MNPYYAYLGLLALMRLHELRVSRRNARRAFARGGIEVGRMHFRAMVLVHVAWFAAAGLEPWLLDRPFVPALGWSMLGVALACVALRYWVIRTLGPAWNIRVVVVPGDEMRRGGPYRFLRHPNYLAVVLEVAAVPLVHTAWLTALVFTVLNAVVLFVRIRCEEEVLRTHCDYDRALGGRRRLLPVEAGTQAQ